MTRSRCVQSSGVPAGLHTRIPDCGLDAEAGEQGGEVSTLSIEKADGSCNAMGHVKAKPGMARSVHSRAGIRNRGIERLLEQQMGDWEDLEIRRFETRVWKMVSAGIDESTAEGTAQQMLYRDRPGSGDDRRVCFECAHLRDARCKKTGFEPVRAVLQRCDWFGLASRRRTGSKGEQHKERHT